MNEAVADTMIYKTIMNKRNFSAVNDGVAFPEHTHDYFEIVLTLSNNLIHTVNGKSGQPQNGDVVILRPSDSHSARPIDDSLPHAIRDIYVSRELFGSACESLSPTLYEQILALPYECPPQFRLSPNQLSSLNKRLEYPFLTGEYDTYGENSELVEMIKKSITVELLGSFVYETFMQEDKMPECVIKLINALQSKRFAQLKIEEMAAQLGYSHTYLCKRFSAYFGKTIERYLIDARVDKSVPLLLQTDMPIARIAQSLGWDKASNYTVAFKRLYGTTPLKYRANNRRDTE